MAETQGGTRNRTRDLQKKGSGCTLSSDHLTRALITVREYSCRHNKHTIPVSPPLTQMPAWQSPCPSTTPVRRPAAPLPSVIVVAQVHAQGRNPCACRHVPAAGASPDFYSTALAFPLDRADAPASQTRSGGRRRGAVTGLPQYCGVGPRALCRFGSAACVCGHRRLRAAGAALRMHGRFSGRRT